MRYYKIIDGETVFKDGKKVVIDGMVYTNPSHEFMLENGWQVYTPPPTPEPTPEQRLQKAKNNKLAEIDAYNESDNVNGFIVNGLQTWIPRELRANFKTSIDSYIALDIPAMTKIWEGIEYTTTPQNWLQMYYIVEYYASECQNVTDRHKISVNAMDNVGDIEAFDVAAGYPEMPVFTI